MQLLVGGSRDLVVVAQFGTDINRCSVAVGGCVGVCNRGMGGELGLQFELFFGCSLNPEFHEEEDDNGKRGRGGGARSTRRWWLLIRRQRMRTWRLW